jgi:hypothetical protein
MRPQSEIQIREPQPSRVAVPSTRLNHIMNKILNNLIANKKPMKTSGRVKNKAKKVGFVAHQNIDCGDNFTAYRSETLIIDN